MTIPSTQAHIVAGDTMKIVAIVSQKGGSGKTTFNWGVAGAIANKFPEKRVLYVDATETQGSRSLMIAHASEKAGHGLGQAMNALFGMLTKGKPLVDQTEKFKVGLDLAVRFARQAIVPVVVGWTDDGKDIKLDFLPTAHGELKAVIEQKWFEETPGMVLGEFLRALEVYDYIVFDTVPDMGAATTSSVLHMADAIAVIQDVRLPENIAGFDELCSDLEKAGVRASEVIMNMYDATYEPSADAYKYASDLARKHKLPVHEVVNDNSKTVRNIVSVYDTSNGGTMSSIWAHGAQTKQQHSKHIKTVVGLLNRVTDRLLVIAEGTHEG